ncbi:MAG: DNA gyrase inhibitor YacG [Sterolibacterium sp.]
MPVHTVNCPTCGKLVDWVAQNRYRPFCSERCKLVDFGAWAAEEYRIPERVAGRHAVLGV